ncbi:helix-turn-helix domain-containing protein [Mangrovihabitans endophyticus]|nr:helix-turn-helix transcriptional regulator [Mangrovihabitans endophyticus]
MPRTLAEKLNHLFATVKPAGRSSFTNAEVAAMTDLSPSYIGYLRTGERDNPTMQTLEALGKCFGVPAAYFYDDEAATRIEDQLHQLQRMAALNEALKRDGVQRLATRMGELSDGGIAAITQLVDLLLEKERRYRDAPSDSAGGGT